MSLLKVSNLSHFHKDQKSVPNSTIASNALQNSQYLQRLNKGQQLNNFKHRRQRGYDPKIRPSQIILSKMESTSANDLKIKKYFEQQIGIPFDENFSPKTQQDYSNPQIGILKDTIHIHGIDLLTPKQIARYFGLFKPQSIKMINPSSANAKFKNETIAIKAFYSNMMNPVSAMSPLDQELLGIKEFDPFIPSRQISEKEWYQMIPYSVFGLFKKVNARFATNLDQRKQQVFNDVIYQKYQTAKLRLKRSGTYIRSEMKKESKRYRSRNGSKKRKYW